MSMNWVNDIKDMHHKYGVHEWVKNNPDKLEQLLHFRVAFLKEEFDETFKAVGEKDAEEMQGVDYSKIVPLLIKSIQELEARVKTLENK